MAQAVSRSRWKAEHRLFTMVFRRMAKAALATRKKVFSSAASTGGLSRRGMSTKALSTLGTGVKQAAGTSMAMTGSQ